MNGPRSLEIPGQLDPLNARELQILELMSKGLSNQEIARKLNLSLETIKWYNKHIFSKLRAGSRSQAIAIAMEAGILAGQGIAKDQKASQLAYPLPVPITSFIGREREIQEVIDLFATSRLVTITGSGGVGKTRLAIQVAHTVLPKFTNGVCWVGLASLYDAAAFQKRERAQIINRQSSRAGQRMGEDLVIEAAIKALRIPESPDRSPNQSVLDFLQDKQLLMVLDNCEHLIEACAILVEQFLSNCPRLTILATSREALGLAGEKAWRLPSLSIPQEAPLPSKPAEHAEMSLTSEEHRSVDQGIYQTESARLFIERAGDVLPGYRPEQVDAPTIAQICQRLDGIPLAIELAAARMNLLSLQEIAARLDRRFSLLTSGHRTALLHHQTLLATIEWSYDLLSQAEQVLLARLTIFSGSFTLVAAEAICASQELPGEEVLTLLGRLVDKSLMDVEAASPDSDLATRYRFLDTIRSFGRLKLEDAGETRWMRDRHAAYYTQLVEAVGPELLLKNQVRWYKLLQAERDNLRAAVEWSSESDQAEIGLRILGALLWFLWSHGSTQEGLYQVLNILALPSAQEPTIFRVRALNTAGYLLWVLGKLDAALQKIEEALTILKQSGDKANLAWSLQILAMVHATKGEYDLADLAMKEGVTVSRELGDYHSSVFSLAFQGDIALQQGDRTKARKVYEESADRLRAFGNKIFLAYPLRRLGYLYLEQDNLLQARDCFRQSLNLNQEVGDKRAVAASLTGLASLAARMNNPAAATILCGAVERNLDLLSMNLLPLDQTELTRLHRELATSQDELTFATAYSEGRGMNEEQAIALIREIFEEES